MLKSVFEIIGPVMVGPSSSHTAGMARIGAEAARALLADRADTPEMIRLTFSRRMEKTYRGHRSDCAVIGGAIGLSPDSGSLKDAYHLAAAKGIRISLDFFEEGEVPQNTVRVAYVWADGSCRSITGQSIGGGSIAILKIDDRETTVRPLLEFGESREHADRIGSIESLLAEKKSFAEIAVCYESARGGRSLKEIRERMASYLDIMKQSVREGLKENALLFGLTAGDEGSKLLAYKSGLCGTLDKAAAYAVAVMEQNASMGRIVASPTGGSAGILPGILLSAAEEKKISDDRLIDALFTASLFGVILDERGVSFSGSIGGCQGEIGVSAAIASAAEASLFTDDKKKIAAAFALTLKNLLGLACDPIGGPIEVPCIKRNAMGCATAMIMCDMALAGITSYIPADEVMDALKDAEQRLPEALKCSCIGGLASTKTACRFREESEMA